MTYKLQTGYRDSPKPFYILAGLLFVAIVGVGSLTFRRLGHTGDGYMTPLSSIGSPTPNPVPHNILGVEKIKGLAATEAPHASVTNVALQQEKNGQFVYVVSLTTGTQLTFDAQTGTPVADAKADQAASAPIPQETPSDKDDATPTDTATSSTSSSSSSDTPPPSPPPSESTPSSSEQPPTQTP